MTQKTSKVCFRFFNKWPIHAYFGLISKCPFFYIKPFEYRKSMFCKIVGKNQIGVFLLYWNYAAYLTNKKISLPLNRHWNQPMSTKCTHLLFVTFHSESKDFIKKIIYHIHVIFLFKAAKLKRPISTKRTHLLFDIFQKANEAFIAKLFIVSMWSFYSKPRS